ncbi:MAG: glycosyltransferase family 4 protein [Elainellaceae cyanobacterium]
MYSLTQAPHEFYLPVKSGKPEGYGGRLPGFAWGNNVHDVQAEDVQKLEFDCILFQSKRNYLQDQYEILSPAQQQLPRLYLEHDPPREHPTDTTHIVNDPEMLLVHVTHFNRLMWNSGDTPTRVIDHGVNIPEGIEYSGDIPKGIVVVNGLRSRGRRLGLDVFEAVRQQVPLDLVGMDSQSLGGLGNIPHAELPALTARYRFFFHPIRYTSLGLAVCEAMMLGLPIIGLATTELPTVIENGVSGYIHTDLQYLIQQMQRLITNPALAHQLGAGAKQQAEQRFNIDRFIHDWNSVFEEAIARPHARPDSISLAPSAVPLSH